MQSYSNNAGVYFPMTLRPCATEIGLWLRSLFIQECSATFFLRLQLRLMLWYTFKTGSWYCWPYSSYKQSLLHHPHSREREKKRSLSCYQESTKSRPEHLENLVAAFYLWLLESAETGDSFQKCEIYFILSRASTIRVNMNLWRLVKLKSELL